MTIAGRMLALIIGPHAINNLLIPSLTLFIFFFSFSLLPSFRVLPSFSPHPAFVLAILLSLPPLPPARPPLSFHLLSSLSSPSMPPHPCSGQPQPASKSLQRAIPPFSASIARFSLQTCSPHFHTFTHSPLILATLPSSSSSSSSSSFSPALLSSEF